MTGREMRPLRGRLKLERCLYEECDIYAVSRGMCSGHYAQFRRGLPLSGLFARSKRKCSFEECDRKHRAKGYCGVHYQQHKRGKKLTPIRARQ